MREVVVNRTKYSDDVLMQRFQDFDAEFFFTRGIVVRVTTDLHERRIVFEEAVRDA